MRIYSKEEAKRIYEKSEKGLRNVIDIYKDAVYYGGDYSLLGQVALSYLYKMCEAVLWLACECDSSPNGSAEWPTIKDLPKVMTPNMSIPQDIKKAAKKISKCSGKIDPFREFDIHEFVELFECVALFADWMAQGLESHNHFELSEWAISIKDAANTLSRYVSD